MYALVSNLNSMNNGLKLSYQLVFTDNMKKYKISDIINLLQVIIHKIEVDDTKQAPFRVRQYQETCKFLDSYPTEYIESFEKLLEYYNNHGRKKSKILDKIKEYFENGKIDEAEKALNDPVVKSVINLTKIYGIGPKKAIELFNKYSITTIEELKLYFTKDSSILNSKQQIGLIHYEDLTERIPRIEMDAYNKALQNICRNISPDMNMSINGSYRRGLKDSGDIDLLITSTSENTILLRKKIISQLKTEGILKEVLADGKKKFMGIVQLKQYGYTKSRHIDIMDTEYKHFPFAVLYFTGSGGFNAYMRGQALKQGYSLNEYRLSDKNTKIEVNTDIIYKKLKKKMFETELDIFQFLNMEYKEPEQRNLT